MLSMESGCRRMAAWLAGCLVLMIMSAGQRCGAISDSVQEHFSENLLIRPLRDGHVYAHFQFKTILNRDIADLQWTTRYNLFPMSIGHLLGQNQVQEMHFSLTKGSWRTHRWGYPVRPAPPGAELWVWFQRANLTPRKSWERITQTLSGQFCASLNQIDDRLTVEPNYAFRPEGVVESESALNQSVHYAALPHESVCTENLTPWKKILPCSSIAGLSTLLDPTHIFNSDYFSLTLDVRPVCRSESDCRSTSVELIQGVSVVFNTPVMHEGKQSWSFLKLFGTNIHQDCSLASLSEIYIDTSSNETYPFRITPAKYEYRKVNLGSDTSRQFAVLNVKQLAADQNVTSLKNVKVGGYYSREHSFDLYPNPVVTATRYVTGYGTASGGIKCQIQNHHDAPIVVSYLDVIPWYLRIYIHTLKVTDQQGNPLKILNLKYSPAKDRQRPHHVEFFVELPPRQMTTISIAFDRAFLRWSEYPPDASHGIYIGAAILSGRLPHAGNLTYWPGHYQFRERTTDASLHDQFVRFHTQVLLINLPTPDFSMPYNVICLVSTVMSLAFGPIYNLTTRQARMVQPGKSGQAGGAGRRAGLFGRLRGLFGSRKTECDAETEGGDSVEAAE